MTLTLERVGVDSQRPTSRRRGPAAPDRAEPRDSGGGTLVSVRERDVTD